MARPPAGQPASLLPPARDPAGPYRVCLVCLGNICRSPMAEVVLRAQLATAGLAGRITVDSAGTGGWHVGEPMNSSARAALARRGYDGDAHRARQFTAAWLPGRDLVLAMDVSNLKTLEPLFRTDPPDSYRLRLFGNAAELRGADVPDPYGGSAAEFDGVLTMLETATPALVDRLAAAVAA
ncbi:MAG: protein-tyrosine-phosphatase [Actinomycetia bacterium]|nr:protein-tyrosine-phosphatase [Actinomycetes bacterium]